MSDIPAVPTPRVLPTGPIPQVAYDTIIEEGWGDSVAQSLNNLTERKGWLTFTPGDEGTPATINAPTSATMAVWLDMPDIFIPDWANVTLIHSEVASIHEGTGGPNTYDLQLSIGGIASDRIVRQTAPVASGLWFPVVWRCLIDVSALSGYQPVQVLARRVAGAGTWVADGYTGVAIEPSFMGAINWYGA